MKKRVEETEHSIAVKGLPSASGFDANFRCLGKRALCKQLPKEEDTALTNRGRRIHKALETTDLSPLSMSEQITVSRCMYAEAELVHDYSFEQAETIWERRLWDVDDDFQRLWSGQVDTLFIQRDQRRLMIDDHKTGWGLPVPIENNWQMKSEAALAADLYEADEAVAALVHPHHPDSLYEVAVYDRDTLRANLETVRGFVRQLQADHLHEGEDPIAWIKPSVKGYTWSPKKVPDAKPVFDSVLPRTPNAVSCQWCMAKRICPEYQAQMAKLQQDVADEVEDKGFTAILRRTPAQRGDHVRQIKMLQDNLKALLEQYTELVAKDEAAGNRPSSTIQGYGIRFKWDRKITDEVKAMKFIEQALGKSALAHALKFNLTALEEHLTRTMTKKDAKARVEEILRGVIKLQKSNPWLEERRAL